MSVREMNSSLRLAFVSPTQESNQDAFGTEFQHLFRSRYVNLRSGIGYFNINGEIESTVEFGPSPYPVPRDVLSTTKTQINHVNAYVYADINLLKNVTLTVGSSYDNLSGDFPGDDTKQFNPKFGIIWNPLLGTTVRAAVFRSLKRTLITDQTLERPRSRL
jgi:outer membrane receptor protein involved in Fe transport